MIETISKILLGVSMVFVATTWLQILSVLRSRSPGVSTWDQWENLGRFRKIVREEMTPDVKRRYASLLKTYLLASMSALIAFALFAWTQVR
jgi:hypothetical protein